METALEDLSASSLRNLLIDEVKKFIVGLDCGSTEDLQRMKDELRRIFALISEKEKQESVPLSWGKNSTNKTFNESRLGSIAETISDM